MQRLLYLDLSAIKMLSTIDYKLIIIFLESFKDWFEYGNKQRAFYFDGEEKH